MSQNKEAIEKAQQMAMDITQDVFFRKLASVGIAPQNVEQAESMWRTALACVQANELPAVKAAAAQADPILQAEQELYRLLGRSAPEVQQKAAAAEAEENQLAFAYAQQPDIYRSMLGLAYASDTQ